MNSKATNAQELMLGISKEQIDAMQEKTMRQGGKVFREGQPTLDWCPGCTPDNCPGGCNRTAPEFGAPYVKDET